MNLLSVSLLIVSVLSFSSCNSYDWNDWDIFGSRSNKIDSRFIGTWRTYLEDDQGQLTGWNEFQFLPDGNFLYYEYDAIRGSYDNESGIYRGFKNQLSIKFDNDRNTQNFYYNFYHGTLIIEGSGYANDDDYDNDTDMIYYRVNNNNNIQALFGTWKFIDTRSGKLYSITFSPNYLVQMQIRHLNNTLTEERYIGRYAVAPHQIKIEWNRTPFGSPSQDLWYYAIDGQNLFSSFWGLTRWQRGEAINYTPYSHKTRPTVSSNSSLRSFGNTKQK